MLKKLFDDIKRGRDGVQWHTKMAWESLQTLCVGNVHLCTMLRHETVKFNNLNRDVHL
jgi:hypothetical protein